MRSNFHTAWRAWRLAGLTGKLSALGWPDMRSSASLASLAVVAGLALLTGCPTTTATKAVPTVDIEVFRDGAIPAKPCKKIAAFKADGTEAEQEQIQAKMISKAKRMGGNAIVFDVPKQGGFKSEFLGSFKWAYIYEATVGVYP
jgi:ABC-type glycerol-3-phosphate transport system substrate-binding protein